MNTNFLEELMMFGRRTGLFLNEHPVIKMSVPIDLFVKIKAETACIIEPLNHHNGLFNTETIQVHAGRVSFEITHEGMGKVDSKDKAPSKPINDEELITEFFVNGCGLAKLDPIMRESNVKFSDLAAHIVFRYAKSEERTVALRKLLESMDCVMRA